MLGRCRQWPWEAKVPSEVVSVRGLRCGLPSPSLASAQVSACLGSDLCQPFKTEARLWSGASRLYERKDQVILVQVRLQENPPLEAEWSTGAGQLEP